MIGRVVGFMMDIGNRAMYVDIFRYLELDLQRGSTVLEIGFGTGRYLGDIAEKVKPGFVAGIDISETMIGLARRKYARQINHGNIKIDPSAVSHIPHVANQFDAVYSANSIYFWEDPGQDIHEVYRVLKPGGHLVLSLATGEGMRPHGYDLDIFRMWEKQEIFDLLTSAGFADIHWTYRKITFEDALTVSAWKPA